MFKAGNIVQKRIEGSQYIILEVIIEQTSLGSKRSPFEMTMKAICLHGSTGYTKPGDTDTWFFKEPDGSDKFDLWRLISEV